MKSIKGKSTAEIKNELEESMADGFSPTLAICFIPKRQNRQKVPMAGMFSNAELGRATGGNLEMHNLTTCCIALKEK
jgi:ribosomal protein L7Ae-like RNA K-turn-binding protein